MNKKQIIKRLECISEDLRIDDITEAWEGVDELMDILANELEEEAEGEVYNSIDISKDHKCSPHCGHKCDMTVEQTPEKIELLDNVVWFRNSDMPDNRKTIEMLVVKINEIIRKINDKQK